MIKHDDILFKLEITRSPDILIKQELETNLKRVLKKINKLKHCLVHIDKLNFFISQSKFDHTIYTRAKAKSFFHRIPR